MIGLTRYLCQLVDIFVRTVITQGDNIFHGVSLHESLHIGHEIQKFGISMRSRGYTLCVGLKLYIRIISELKFVNVFQAPQQ